MVLKYILYLLCILHFIVHIKRTFHYVYLNELRSVRTRIAAFIIFSFNLCNHIELC